MKIEFVIPGPAQAKQRPRVNRNTGRIYTPGATHKYEKDGQKKSFTKVKVDRLEFLGGGKQEEHDPTGKFKEVLDDDELPF